MTNTQLPQHSIKSRLSHWRPNTGPSRSNRRTGSQEPRVGWHSAVAGGRANACLCLMVLSVPHGLQPLLSHVNDCWQKSWAARITFSHPLMNFWNRYPHSVGGNRNTEVLRNLHKVTSLRKVVDWGLKPHLCACKVCSLSTTHTRNESRAYVRSVELISMCLG